MSNQKLAKELLTDGLFVAGVAAVTYGLYRIDEVYAWVFFGLACMTVAVNIARRV